MTNALFVSFYQRDALHSAAIASGVGTGGSGGSMNRDPELLGPPSSGATEFFLGKTLRKIIKIGATR